MSILTAADIDAIASAVVAKMNGAGVASADQVARIEAALGTVAGIATRKLSRTKQAKKAGCSVRTLQRREMRARVQLIADRVL